MMFPYMYEAQFLVEESATPSQVDAALKRFGMAMGIFEVDDMAGIDVAWRVRRELGHFAEPGIRKPLVADKLTRWAAWPAGKDGIYTTGIANPFLTRRLLTSSDLLHERMECAKEL
jgi:3-hydroxyacyl-CoA dehydrogenase